MFFNNKFKVKLSPKGQKLLEIYKDFFNKGYLRKDGTAISKENTYNDFELKILKNTLLTIFKKYSIDSVVDYGSGRSNWYEKNFHDNLSAIEFFNLKQVLHYEPSLEKNFIKKLDCVSCFDVLEHIYINDLNKIIRHIYSNANKLVIISIACYHALALLPNKENAHVTVRPPIWWKGFIESISMEYPLVNTFLICRTTSKEYKYFKIWNNAEYDLNENYTIELK